MAETMAETDVGRREHLSRIAETGRAGYLINGPISEVYIANR